MNTRTETVKAVGGLVAILGLMIVLQYISSRFLGINPFYLN